MRISSLLSPRSFRLFAASLAAVVATSCAAAQPEAARADQGPEVVRVWPGAAPGTEDWTGAEVEVDADLPAGRVHIVTNVSAPTLTVFRPSAGRANGTAVLVLPGGAFRALAWDLEGTEVAQWLAGQGFTAFVLRYRVRPPAGQAPSGPEAFDAWLARMAPARALAVADARQALRLIRAGAARYGIAADRVGTIGFSAGAIAAMEVALSGDPAVRPDFAASIYGAVPVEGPPPAGAPPLFVVAAQDDPQVPAAKSAEMFERWTAARIPAELHLYERGGHGFGMRARDLPAGGWPAAFAAWLRSRGLMSAGGPAAR